ncbi:iron complex transport system substrate-binding protein [Cytobacillus eiseniae]|uniref:Iron complex transport system substrate-binding protein n=1 Tax=Cytobacillus eiseniae TaxID=762947 RepID=A0ABS4RJY0_9BACI|nr:ABC transporter substrate-binding protein [Cytobacillus eiseniae]MBP2242102.1 iron complex transport system substrate-binding protein [Cytobacillus eiseniae]
MKRWVLFGGAALLTLALAGCGETEETISSAGETTEQASTETNEAKIQTISYLGNDYPVSAPADRIVAASLEAMEDAAVLGVKPTGVLEIAGEIPTYLAEDLAGASLIGDKRAPNAEAVLALDPDVIIGTSKWGEDIMAEMNKIQTTLPYSHISTNWKANLLAFAQVAGKEEMAETIISDYEAKAETAKLEAAKQLAEQTILVIRVRGGLMYIYPPGVYLNPVLYEDLGAAVPEIIANAEAQAEITMETLASINPDAIFLQFEESENTDAPTALEDLQSNPIFASLTAAQNNQIFVNSIDPLAQGGTAWSKVKFLDKVIEHLLQ